MFTFSFSFFLPPFLRAGILERERGRESKERMMKKGGGGRARGEGGRVFKIHKGFVINASTTIKTKTLKGEKTCFCVKQLVLQH